MTKVESETKVLCTSYVSELLRNITSEHTDKCKFSLFILREKYVNSNTVVSECGSTKPVWKLNDIFDLCLHFYIKSFITYKSLNLIDFNYNDKFF